MSLARMSCIVAVAMLFAVAEGKLALHQEDGAGEIQQVSSCEGVCAEPKGLHNLGDGVFNLTCGCGYHCQELGNCCDDHQELCIDNCGGELQPRFLQDPTNCALRECVCNARGNNRCCEVGWHDFNPDFCISFLQHAAPQCLEFCGFRQVASASECVWNYNFTL